MQQLKSRMRARRKLLARLHNLPAATPPRSYPWLIRCSKPPLSPIEMLPYDLLDLIGEQIPLLSIEVAARVQKQRG